MRANIELEQGFADAALIDLEAASALEPEDADIYVMMGDIYVQQKDKDKARQAYGRAVELGIPAVQLQEKLKQCR